MDPKIVDLKELNPNPESDVRWTPRIRTATGTEGLVWTPNGKVAYSADPRGGIPLDWAAAFIDYQHFVLSCWLLS
jgi:hypothetical protein